MDLRNTTQAINDDEAFNHISSTVKRITQSRLKEILAYNPETGSLTWLISLSNRTKIGDIAGCLHHSGYIRVRIGGIDYGAHTLAWLYMFGEYVKLDHEDRNKGNNRLYNLRVTDNTLNNANRSLPSKLGIRGIRRTRSGRFEARIQNRYYAEYLGTFDTIEEANAVYKKAAVKYFGEFANG